MGENQRTMITMSEQEIADFVDVQRIATVATIGPTGHAHLVAMWYAVLDGEIWIETKAKSQKVVNLQRDNRVSLLIEAGSNYDELRGVSFEGIGLISDDFEDIWQVGVCVFERYVAPYSEHARPQVESMIHNRVVVRFTFERVRSWDHRKLGLKPTPVGGSTT
jgi:PPOX class probable F420-dependent enzyme